MDFFYNKIKSTAMALALVTVTAGASSAATMTLDFSSESIGAIAGGTFMTSQDGLDFTFAGPGLQFRTLPAAFSAAYGINVWLSSTFDAGPITMSIAGAVINSVRYLNPINGSATSEIDFIDAVARNAASVVLDSISSSAEYNTLVGPDIASIVFNEANSNQGFVLGRFDIDFDRVAVVPLPATLPLMLAGFAGFAAIRRKKKQA